jgi:hypothetical protein
MVFLSGCAAAGDMELPVDHALKRAFVQAEALGRFEAIPAQNVLFTNEVNWNAFWRKHAITPPKVDFATNMVFAVFAGQKPSSGYAVEVKKIVFQTGQKKLLIEILEIEPPPNIGTLSVLTFPYDMVTFKRPGEWKAFEITKRKRRGKS